MRTHINFPALRATLSHKGRARTSRCARTSTSPRCAPPSPTRGEGEHRDAHAHPFPGAARPPLPQGEGRTSRCARTSISRCCAPPSPTRGEGEHRDAHAHQSPGAVRHALQQGHGVAGTGLIRAGRAAIGETPTIAGGIAVHSQGLRSVGMHARASSWWTAASPPPNCWKPASAPCAASRRRRAQRTQPAITNSAIAASQSTRMRQARAMASRSSGISPKTSAMAVVGVRPDSA